MGPVKWGGGGGGGGGPWGRYIPFCGFKHRFGPFRMPKLYRSIRSSAAKMRMFVLFDGALSKVVES